MRRILILVAMAVMLYPTGVSAQEGHIGAGVKLHGASPTPLDTDVTDSSGAYDLDWDDAAVDVEIDVSGVSNSTTGFSGSIEADSNGLSGLLVVLKDSSGCVIDADYTDTSGGFTLSVGSGSPDVIVIDVSTAPSGATTLSGDVFYLTS